jgi:hypothetical protein
MNPPGEEGGWYYSIRLSQIQEQFGAGREIWAAGAGTFANQQHARTICNSTRARVLPLFEVRWSGWGSVAYL